MYSKKEILTDLLLDGHRHEGFEAVLYTHDIPDSAFPTLVRNEHVLEITADSMESKQLLDLFSRFHISLDKVEQDRGIKFEGISRYTPWITFIGRGFISEYRDNRGDTSYSGLRITSVDEIKCKLDEELRDKLMRSYTVHLTHSEINAIIRALPHLYGKRSTELEDRLLEVLDR